MTVPILKPLIGKKIRGIFMSSEFLVFITDDEQEPVIAYTVEGDCCSYSYFYDFYGVKNLLENGPIIEAEPVSLDDPENPNDHGEWTVVYGYRLTTEHPMWGLVSSVFSFRNDSNGNYGGWMERTHTRPHLSALTLVQDDVIEIDA
jgi:hypothetical protein